MPVLLRFIVDLLGHVLVLYDGIIKIYCGPIGSCVMFPCVHNSNTWYVNSVYTVIPKTPCSVFVDLSVNLLCTLQGKCMAKS